MEESVENATYRPSALIVGYWLAPLPSPAALVPMALTRTIDPLTRSLR